MSCENHHRFGWWIGRGSMKTVAALACKVTEGLCQLPGVATLDWCDRAAGVLSLVRPGAVATIAVGLLDNRSAIQLIESTGTARSGRAVMASGRSATGNGVPRLAPQVVDRAPADLDGVREQFREGQWLGWDFAPLNEGEVYVQSVKLTPATNRRFAPPLSQRYDAMLPSDIVLAAVGLSGDMHTASHHRRVLIAEIALDAAQPGEVERIEAVLSAVLPMLGSRYLNAIGSEPATKQSWLTPREEVILWKLVAGKRVPVIADELHRSIYTVHDHVKSLHKKLGANNRGQLVSRALGHLGPLLSGEEASTATIVDE